jgi:hypothetical protein
MSKQKKVRIVTLVVIVIAFAVTAGRQTEWRWSGSSAAQLLSPKSEEPPNPIDAINRMMDAARDGDVESYLNCFSGQMEKMLRQSASEMTSAGFARYLTENNRQIKGFAMYEPKVISEREVQVRVEYVYVDRNEAQQFHLEKQEADWTIARVDGVERVETLIPYGTPVY